MYFIETERCNKNASLKVFHKTWQHIPALSYCRFMLEPCRQTYPLYEWVLTCSTTSALWSGWGGMGMMTMIGWSNQCQTDRTVKMVKYELVSQIYFIMLIQCLSVCLSFYLSSTICYCFLSMYFL